MTVMTHLTACVAGIVLTLSMMPLSAQSPGGLTVRFYNSANLSIRDVERAQQVAEPILRDAGLDVLVRHCGGPTTVDRIIDRCHDLLRPGDVVVRLIDAPKYQLALGPHVFGVAHLVRGTGGGRLATLYSNRIIEAAARVKVETGTLLGRVLAHEVGHLLLGTNAHGETGLMRADWTDEMLHRGEARDWRFSIGEAVAMQHGLIVNPLED
jgi:hypothetical protein